MPSVLSARLKKLEVAHGARSPLDSLSDVALGALIITLQAHIDAAPGRMPEITNELLASQRMDLATFNRASTVLTPLWEDLGSWIAAQR